MTYALFRDQFAALAPHKYPAEYIDAQVRSGNWKCWSNGKAAILATIKRYPSGFREVEGLAAAGDAQSILSLIPQAEEWGRQHGCSEASIASRPAWSRLLPDYTVDQIKIVKEL